MAAGKSFHKSHFRVGIKLYKVSFISLQLSVNAKGNTIDLKQSSIPMKLYTFCLFLPFYASLPLLSPQKIEKAKEKKKVFQQLAVSPSPLKSTDVQEYEAENKHGMNVIIWDSGMYYEGNLESVMIPKNG